MFNISIISGEDGSIIFPSFNLNFTNVTEQNNTNMLAMLNETEYLDDYEKYAELLAFYWNVTNHTDKIITC